MLWNWRTCSLAVTLSGHQAPVVSVDMSLNGLYMVSGDKNGWVIIWDAIKQDAKLVLNLHDGAVLCVSIAPDGSRIISSGRDEHVCVIDCETGDEVFNLDDALDGKGLTVKFSFDGASVQVRDQRLLCSLHQSCTEPEWDGRQPGLGGATFQDVLSRTVTDCSMMFIAMI